MTMKYKRYEAIVEFDAEDRVFHGRVAGLRDVVTFEGDSVEALERAFQESVDDYLALCKEQGQAPDKPFSGQFVVRIDPELHRKAAVAAERAGKSLNRWVADAITHETA
jgi:predicted HicB family RNase H-like nuclease